MLTLDNTVYLGKALPSSGGGGGADVSVDNETIVKNAQNVISTVGVKDQNSGDAIKTWVGVKADYDLIDQKDPDTTYIVTDDNSGVGGTWGSITGTLSDQTDLQTALDNKADKDLSNATPSMQMLESEHTIGYTNFAHNESNRLSSASTWPLGEYNGVTPTSYEFVLHFFYNGGTQKPLFNCLASGSYYGMDPAKGGFGFTIENGSVLKLFSQTEKGNTSTTIYHDNIAQLSSNTEYWFKMLWDGTTYTYITATDKNFTNLVGNYSFTSSTPITSTQQVAMFGDSVIGTTVFNGIIYISDCYLKIDGVKVFDGSDPTQYIVGSGLTLVENNLLKTQGTAYVVESYQKDNSWYRVWSDGWCEQGGKIPLRSGSISISLLKAYSSTEYTMRITNMAQSAAVWLDGVVELDYFKIYSNGSNGWLYWETKGYLQPASES